MELSFNLEKMFPTEESRFSAYKKWIISSAVFGPVAWLSGRALEAMIRIAERSYRVSSSFETWLGILSIFVIIAAGYMAQMLPYVQNVMLNRIFCYLLQPMPKR